MKTKRLLRNMYAAIAALFINLLPTAAQTDAEPENFPLWICGIQVTTDNMEDISGPGISGIVRYEPRTTTLTLQKSTLTAKNVEALKSQVEGLVIVLNGPNYMEHSMVGTTRPSNAIQLDAKTTIKGQDLDVKVTSHRSAAMAIAPRTKVSLIKGCRVALNGFWGVLGDTANCSSKLLVQESMLAINKQALGTDQVLGNSISGLSELTLEACAMTQPEGSWFRAQKGFVADYEGTAVRGCLVIEPAELYGIRVAGIEVHSQNCGSISGPGIQGDVHFNFTEKTLYVDHATVKHPFHPAIEFYGHNITRSYRLYAGKRSILTGSSTPSLLTSAALYIIGPGLIEVEADTTAAIAIGRSSLIIKQARVKAKGRYGIVGETGLTSIATLQLKGCELHATGYDGSVCGLASLTLDDCEITQPRGGYFDSRDGYVANPDGTLATGEVIVQPVSTAIAPLKADVQPSPVYSLDGKRMGQPHNALPKGVYIYKGKKAVKH